MTKEDFERIWNQFPPKHQEQLREIILSHSGSPKKDPSPTQKAIFQKKLSQVRAQLRGLEGELAMLSKLIGED